MLSAATLDRDRGLTRLVNNDFFSATVAFKSLLDGPNADSTYLYYHAVAQLGNLLTILHYESFYCNNVFRTKQLNQLVQQVANNISQPSNVDVSKLENVVNLVFSEFDFINKLCPKKAGVEYALSIKDTLVKDACNIDFHLSKNSLSVKHRTDYAFSTELVRFKILYLTQLIIKQELEQEQERRNRQFLNVLLHKKPPQFIQDLEKILDQNKEDELFISLEGISNLYKLIDKTQANEKDKNMQMVCDRLKEHVYFFDGKRRMPDDFNFMSLNVFQKRKDNTDLINFNELILLNDFCLKYENMLIVIKALDENYLLNKKIFNQLKEINLASPRYLNSVKKIVQTIQEGKLPNQNKLVMTLFDCLLDKMSHKIGPTAHFQQYSALVKKNCINDDKVYFERIYIYLDLLQLMIENSAQDAQSLSLDYLNGLMQEITNAIGDDYCVKLYAYILTHKLSPRNFSSLMTTILQLKDEFIKQLFELLDQHQHDPKTLQHGIKEIVKKNYQSKYPERPLDDVIQEFQTSPDVEFPIAFEELILLKERYLLIKEIGEKLLTKNSKKLLLKLEECKKELQTNRDNKEAQATLFAIIRLQAKAILNINPYNIQILNMLALLNQPKRIAQIKTGEGKSTLIAMLAAYYAIMGYKVDVITTSNDLSIRDSKKFEKFYWALNISVGYLDDDHQANSNCDGKSIRYGTLSAFSFAYLRQETQASSDGGNPQQHQVCIADEVDSMLLDMQRHEAILSCATNDGYNEKVYRTIWLWIETTSKEAQTPENLQSMLQEKIGIEVNIDLATTWVKSAKTAMRLSENKEYVIACPNQSSNKVPFFFMRNNNDPVIKIVNKETTGEVLKETSRWQNGIHEFLEAKHHLRIHSESLMCASISPVEYFNKYQILIGLTGTVGAAFCRDELKELYGVNTYDSPPYLPSLKKPITPHLLKNKEEQDSAIEAVIRKITEERRPVLVLCETIQESKDLHTQLSSKGDLSVQIYNGVQQNSSEAILELAGGPGMITVATNLAGRGTDIVVTPEAELHGGLHVIVTFPTQSERVWAQAVGRTGRQGKKGTYHYILRENQLSAYVNVHHAIYDVIDDKMAAFFAVRDERERCISEMNLLSYDWMHKIFILQSIFFALPVSIKSLYMHAQWAKLKTKIQKDVAQCMSHDEPDVVISEILNQFSIFWQDNIAKHGPHYQSPLIFINAKSTREKADAYLNKLFDEAQTLFENADCHAETKINDEKINLDRAPDSKKEQTNHFNFNQFIMLHELCNQYPDLLVVIKALDENNLMDADVFDALSKMNSSSPHHASGIEAIAKIIKDNKLPDQDRLLIKLRAFASDKKLTSEIQAGQEAFGDKQVKSPRLFDGITTEKAPTESQKGMSVQLSHH